MNRFLMTVAFSAAFISPSLAVECFPLQAVLEHESKQGKVLAWSGIGGADNIPTAMLAHPETGAWVMFFIDTEHSAACIVGAGKGGKFREMKVGEPA